MYKGWIIISKKGGSREELEELGVELLGYNKLHGSYICYVPEEAMEALDKLWGTYIWSLELMEGEEV